MRRHNVRHFPVVDADTLETSAELEGRDPRASPGDW